MTFDGTLEMIGKGCSVVVMENVSNGAIQEFLVAPPQLLCNCWASPEDMGRGVEN
jgi:hypothetical protein